MGLLDQIEQDNAVIIEDDEGGIARPVTLTDPAGPVYQVKGIVARIGTHIDPGTGLRVPGGQTEVTVRLSALNGAIPVEGWTVATTDVTGAAVTGKAQMVAPDRMAGRVTLYVRA